MAKAAAPPPNDRWWQILFLWSASLVALAGIWFVIQTKDYRALVLGLAAAIALVIISQRPWRRAEDSGVVALWVVGGLLLFLGLLSSQDMAPFLAGAGAGFIVGLAVARHLYPKATP